MSTDGADKDANPTSLKGKRKKKVPPPASANPLFSQWLAEWRDQAVEKGWKSSHTYAKALKTLRLFPLPLETGKDCRLLQNFGDKICKMLDEKLSEYNKANPTDHHTTSYAPPTSNSNRDHTQPTDGPTFTRLTHPPPDQASVAGSSRGQRSTISTHSISDSSGDEGGGEAVRPAPKKRKSTNKGPREYVPVYRSGPYALLVTFYKYMQDPQFKGYLGKTELCQASQPLCDKSFMVPDPGSRYTAWSSVGSLIKKGIMAKASSPAQYSLTDTGVELAHRLMVADVARQEGASLSPSSCAAFHSPTKNGHSTRPGHWSTGDTCSPSRARPATDGHVSLSPSPHKLSQSSMDCYVSPSKSSPYKPTSFRSDLFSSPSKNLVKNSCSSGSYGSSKYSSNLNKPSPKSYPPRKSAHVSDDEVMVLDDVDGDVIPTAGHHIPTDIASSSKDVHRLSPSSHCNSPPPMDESFNNSFSQMNDSFNNSLDQQPLSLNKNLGSSFSPNCKSLPSTNLQGPNFSKNSELASSSPLRHAHNISMSPEPSPFTVNEVSVGQGVGSEPHVLEISDDDDEDMIQAKRLSISLSGEDVAITVKKKVDNFKKPLAKNFYSFSDSDSDDEDMKQAKRLSLSLTNNNDVAIDLEAKPAPVEDFNKQISKQCSSFSDSDDDEDMKEAKRLSLSLTNNDVAIDLESKPVEAFNKPISKQCSTFSDSDDDNSDLPDLELPLFKRLLMKGNIKSQLLKDSEAASNKYQPPCYVSPTPISVDDSPDNEQLVTEILHSKTTRPSESLLPTMLAPQSSKSILSLPDDLRHTSNQDHQSFKKPAALIAQERDMYKSDTVSTSSSSVFSSTTSSSTSLLTSSIVSKPLITEFTLLPGSFDIVLCIDNREFYGAKSNSKTLLPELMKSGVTCDLRLLHVGDLLWVAREKTALEDIGMNRGKGREVVLNYIVERKRMDDLVSSMTDGRMKEQKFRMKESGVKDCIILVEEHGSIQNFSLSEQRIRQSIANSQIIDGFRVKQCRSGKEAVTYLAALTRCLQRQFVNKTIHAVSVDQFRAIGGGRPSPYDKELYLCQFDAFNQASVKSRDPTVKEMFLRQLTQLPGVSGERARAITQLYPTLASLLDAYRSCPTHKDKEALLSKIKSGKTDRNLGISVSRTVAMLYTQGGRLS